MFNTIRQKLGQLTGAALAAVMQYSGTAALYLGASTLLAAILTAAIVTYAWGIDRERWFRALAILQGVDIAEIQKAEREAAYDIGFEDSLERRAQRGLEDEFNREITQRAVQWQLPLGEPEPPPPPPPSDADRISAYERRVQADIARSRTDGLAQLTDILTRANSEWAKEVIRRLWQEGHNRLVIDALLELEERPRERILFAMQETNDEELKDLCEIWLRIAAGEPRTSILEEAAREP